MRVVIISMLLLLMVLPSQAVMANDGVSASMQTHVERPDGASDERQNKDWIRVGVCGTTMANAEDAIADAYRRGPDGIIEVYPGFTKRLVTCVQAMTERVADAYLGPLQDIFSVFAHGAIIIYIMVFGIKVALGGVRSIKADFLVVVLTIAFVSYAVMHNGLNTYYGYFVGVQDALVGIVTSTINDAHNVAIDTNGDGAEDTVVLSGLCNDYRDAWQKLDCTLALYMGANPEVFAGQPGGMAVAPYSAYDSRGQVELDAVRENGGFVSLAPFVLLSGALFTKYGLALFLLGIGFIMLLILAVAQAVIVYVGALVVITFLAIVGYITIPLALFQPTRQIFDNWLQLLIAYTLQPAIVMGYLAFMVHVLDIAFNPSNGDPLGLDGLTPMSVLYEQFYSGDKGECRKRYEELLNATVSTEGQQDAENTGECVTTETSEAGQTRVAVQSKSIVVLEQAITCDQFESILNANPNTCEADLPQIYKDLKNRGLSAFLQNMIIVTLLMLITFTFMANVLSFGATLAGITAAPVNGALNFYNKAMAKMTAPKKR